MKGCDTVFYCIVKKNISFISLIPAMLILIITALLCFFTTTVYPYLPIFIAGIGICISLYLIPRATVREYEYSVEGDIFTVSLIKNKASRKELFSCEIFHLISCTPYEQHSPLPTASKTINASVHYNTPYGALFSEDENKTLIIFSPSDDFVNSLRILAPGKVNCNILK